MKHNISPAISKVVEGSRLYTFARAVYIFALLAGASPQAIAAEKTAFGQAVALMSDEKWTQARDLTLRSADSDLSAMYQWMLYRKDDVTGLPFNSVTNFIRTHPDWPEMSHVRATAERVMPADLPALDVMAWYRSYPPVSGKGIMRYIEAAQAAGATGEVSAMIATVWPQAQIENAEQETLLATIGRQLPLSVHLARLDKLLTNQQYTQARSLGNFLGGGYSVVVDARIALAENKPNIGSYISRIPKNLQYNTGLLLDRIRWRRKNDDTKGAVELINSLSPAQLASINAPDQWWKERNILARRLIEEHDFVGAYKLVSNHTLNNGTEYAEAEWLSGWLALRFLGHPDTALIHFTDMYKNVETSISKSRAAYWAGRAAEKSPTAVNTAPSWFECAAGYPHTYYGQLALRHVKRNMPPLHAVITTPQDIQAVSSSSLARTAEKLRRTSFDKLSVQFLNAALGTFTTDGEYRALADTLSKQNDISGAYRVAKAASWKNIYIGEAYTPSLLGYMQTTSTDKALLHGIIRQESQFDTKATSPSGALGLTQLMPATARETAGKLGVSYQSDWLTTNPAFNIKIGDAYINNLLTRFDGSYPLAIAAYNAGPRRVNEWIEEFGDPRAGKVDWIDWLEMIPVAETRNYVQRVTEGVVLYREYAGMK